MPFAIEAASRPDSEVNAIGSETETLEISTATAGAATERRLRTAAGVGAFGDCENRRVSSICTRFANRRLCSPKGRCACSHGDRCSKTTDRCAGSERSIGSLEGNWKLVEVCARATRCPGSGNMQADEDRVPICVCQGRAVFIGRIGIVVASHHNPVANSFELCAQNSCDL